jgi:hypothetical protein
MAFEELLDRFFLPYPVHASGLNVRIDAAWGHFGDHPGGEGLA